MGLALLNHGPRARLATTLPNETVLASAVVAIKLTESAKVAENEKQLRCCMVGDKFNKKGKGKGKSDRKE